jgi:hypothetical protein
VNSSEVNSSRAVLLLPLVVMLSMRTMTAYILQELATLDGQSACSKSTRK